MSYNGMSTRKYKKHIHELVRAYTETGEYISTSCWKCFKVLTDKKEAK